MSESMSEEALSRLQIEVLEARLFQALEDRRIGPPKLPKGWTQHLGLTRCARSLLLEGREILSFDGRNSTYGPKWRARGWHTWGGLLLGGSVYPLRDFLRRDLKGTHGILEEMCLWHFLNYYAHFSLRYNEQRKVYRICRYHQRPPPWTPQDRAGLVRLFQILGILSFNSLEEFARAHGHYGCADRIQIDLPVSKVACPYSPPGAYSSGPWPTAPKGFAGFSPLPKKFTG